MLNIVLELFIIAQFLENYSFFFFWPHHAACGMLVPQPGIEGGPRQGERGVLTTGLPGNSIFNMIIWHQSYWMTSLRQTFHKCLLNQTNPRVLNPDITFAQFQHISHVSFCVYYFVDLPLNAQCYNNSITLVSIF